MTKFRNSIFMLTLSSLSLYGGGLFAQTSTDNNIRLGYCTTSYSRGLIAQGQTGSHIYHAAIHVTSDLLDKYEGDKIEAIEFAIKPKRGRMADVFICTDLDNITSSKLSTASTTSYEEGWNKVDLKKPVTITKGMDIYIGYEILIEDGEAYDCLLFDNSTFSVTAKNWYGIDDQWSNNTAGINRNLCIRAIVSGDKIPDNDVTLLKVVPEGNNDYAEQNKPKTYYAYVQNNGSKTVNSLSISNLTTTSKGSETTTSEYEGLEIPNNEPTKITLNNVTFPLEGNFTSAFTVSKVNGVDDPYPQDNTIESKGFSIKEGTSPVPRNVLLEEFTSEGYEECPAADEMHASVIEDNDYDYVVWVKHHRNYKDYKDQFVIDEDADYSELYGTTRPFVPATAYDRQKFTGMEDSGPAYFVPYTDQMCALIDGAKNVLSFVSLNVKPTFSENAKTLNVVVDGTAGTNEMPLQTDLRLTTWLVEDGIKSTTQLGATDYVQNGVIRKVLSGNAWGDALDISNYDFEKTYSVSIDPSWNVNNLRVVSFVSNYNSDALRRTVYNTEQAKCKAPVSSISTTKGGNERQFTIVGGQIFANQGFTILDVCDVAGRKVSAKNLSQGGYIVRTTDGKQVFTKKINIER